MFRIFPFSHFRLGNPIHSFSSVKKEQKRILRNSEDAPWRNVVRRIHPACQSRFSGVRFPRNSFLFEISRDGWLFFDFYKKKAIFFFACSEDKKQDYYYYYYAGGIRKCEKGGKLIPDTSCVEDRGTEFMKRAKNVAL